MRISGIDNGWMDGCTERLLAFIAYLLYVLPVEQFK